MKNIKMYDRSKTHNRRERKRLVRQLEDHLRNLRHKRDNSTSCSAGGVVRMIRQALRYQMIWEKGVQP